MGRQRKQIANIRLMIQLSDRRKAAVKGDLLWEKILEQMVFVEKQM